MLSGSLLSYLKKRKISRNGHSLSLVVIRCHSLYHSLSLVVIRCHSLYHSLSFVVTRCTTRCHSLSFVVTRCTTRCHSLSLDVQLVCLFINDRSETLATRANDTLKLNNGTKPYLINLSNFALSFFHEIFVKIHNITTSVVL